MSIRADHVEAVAKALWEHDEGRSWDSAYPLDVDIYRDRAEVAIQASARHRLSAFNLSLLQDDSARPAL